MLCPRTVACYHGMRQWMYKDLQLVSSLRMSGDAPPLPLQPLMACTGPTSPETIMMTSAEANYEGVPTKNHVVYTKSDEALATVLKS
jgi:hypothetical protein